MQVQSSQSATNAVSSRLSSEPSPILTPPSALSTPTLASASAASANKTKPVKNLRPKSKKQIPTILGLLILFVALISGVLLFGNGTGVFAPRATAETTPKNVRISNVTDKTFTISFYTDESTIAFVKYGEKNDALSKQASDDRDQLSGVVKDYHLHHVTVRGLSPGKEYFYVLGTGSNTFDNEGNPYSISTASKPNQSPTSNQTVYGNVLMADGSPAEGSVVYVYAEGMGALSTLVKSSGSWGISLANAFNIEKTGYASLTDDSALDVKAQGIEIGLLASSQVTVVTAQPVADLILGGGATPDMASSADVDASGLVSIDKTELLAGTESTQMNELDESSDLASKSTSASADLSEDKVEILNLSELDESQEASATTITTTQPQIKATLPANTMIRVVIHSDTTIDETVQTNANGEMVLDVASLGQNLEPGEHTASYTYIDPTTGKEVTKTYNFTVAPTATASTTDPTSVRQLAALTTPVPTAVPSIPYGSGNPYSPSKSPTASVSPISTRSAIVSTSSGQYNSGSVGTTIALLLGGLFFVLAGVWSYFLAGSLEGAKEQ